MNTSERDLNMDNGKNNVVQQQSVEASDKNKMNQLQGQRTQHVFCQQTSKEKQKHNKVLGAWNQAEKPLNNVPLTRRLNPT